MKNQELKNIIREMVLQETEKITMGGAYRWKEELMQRIQEAVISRIDLVESQDEYESVVDSEVEKLKEDIDNTLEMIARSLYQVPFQAFKRK
jgi:hypothetical protein